MPVTRGQGNPDWTRDETILALATLLRSWPKIPGKRSDEVKELSDLIRRLPIHAHAEKNDRFRNPDGVYLKLQNLASLHADKADRKGLRTSETDRRVWADYSADPATVNALAAEIASGIAVLEAIKVEEIGDTEAFEAIEGAVLTRVHRMRERKRGFRHRLIRRVEARYGSLRCEACQAIAIVGAPISHAMFEVHHSIPLAQAATTLTRLDDLTLLCANCHRLIHAVMTQERRHFLLADFREWLSDA